MILKIEERSFFKVSSPLLLLQKRAKMLFIGGKASAHYWQGHRASLTLLPPIKCSHSVTGEELARPGQGVKIACDFFCVDIGKNKLAKRARKALGKYKVDLFSFNAKKALVSSNTNPCHRKAQAHRTSTGSLLRPRPAPRIFF